MVQAMQHREHLRRFLYEEGFVIEEEVLVYEDHYYEILRCKKGQERPYDFRFSKGLFKEKELYCKYLQDKLSTLDFILEKTKERDQKKHQEVLEEKTALEQHCLEQNIVLY